MRSGECKRCGFCCNVIRHEDDLVITRCEHLTETNLCRIYERRPDQCREWPRDVHSMRSPECGYTFTEGDIYAKVDVNIGAPKLGLRSAYEFDEGG